MPGDDPRPPVSASPPAAERWNERVAACAAAVPPPPMLPLAEPARARSIAWAREVLPPVGGTVLDIGCGAGSGSLALVPPASEIIGVDPRGVLLDEFVAAASARSVARRTVHGHWPDVVATTPVADVAICQQVVQTVADIVPFVLTLTDRARLAVVVELPSEHPPRPMRALAESLGVDVGAPAVVASDLVPVLAELGLAPETGTDERVVAGIGELTAFARSVRAWCARGDEGVEAAIAEHVAGRPIETLTLRWPGAADPTF